MTLQQSNETIIENSSSSQSSISKDVFSSKDCSKSANTSSILGTLFKPINQESKSLYLGDIYTCPSSSQQSQSDSAMRIFETWRDKTVNLLESWPETSVKDFTDFIRIYLIAFLDKRDIRLLIASVDNIIRFNHPIQPQQAKDIALFLREIAYNNIHQKLVLSFVRTMRAQGLSAS